MQARIPGIAQLLVGGEMYVWSELQGCYQTADDRQLVLHAKDMHDWLFKMKSADYKITAKVITTRECPITGRAKYLVHFHDTLQRVCGSTLLDNLSARELIDDYRKGRFDVLTTTRCQAVLQ